MRDYVNALLTQNGTVLLARRAVHRDDRPNEWNPPGGRVEPGESIEDALARELQEETGLTPVAFRKLGTMDDPRPGYADVAYHMYIVTGWSGGEPRLLGDEHSELRWFAIDEACARTDLAFDTYVPFFRRLNEPG